MPKKHGIYAASHALRRSDISITRENYLDKHAADNVFLNRIQGGPKISCSVSKTSRAQERRGADRALVRILPPVSCRARG
jgi:hypothetical protein